MRVNGVRTVLAWTAQINERRSRGELIPDGELLEYQQAKVMMLEKIAGLPEAAGSRANETLAAARARLAEMEGGEGG